MPSEQDALGVGGASKQENLEQVYHQFDHQAEVALKDAFHPQSAFGKIGEQYLLPVVAANQITDWDDFYTKLQTQIGISDPLNLVGATEDDWLAMFVSWYRGVALHNADPDSFSELAITIKEIVVPDDTPQLIQDLGSLVPPLGLFADPATNYGIAGVNWTDLIDVAVNTAVQVGAQTEPDLRNYIEAEIVVLLIARNLPPPDWPTGYDFSLNSEIERYVGDVLSQFPTISTADTALTGKFDQFFGANLNSVPIGADWDILNQSSLGTLVTPSDVADQFIAMFNDFVQSDGYLDTAPGAPEFFISLSNYLTRAAVLQSANKDGATFGIAPTVDDVRQSFEDVYTTLLPGRTQQQFTEDLAFFFKNRIAERGFFVPSQEVDNWTSFIDSIEPLFAGTLATIGSEKVLVLDRIFTLVVMMIDVLQELAAVQADRLFFLTKWQKAYTEAIDQIHVFIGGNDAEDWTGIRIDGDNEAAAFAAMRTELNQLNTSFKERLTANRQVVADDAKAHQSAVNQSNDAVTQQSNIATAILQQLSTILGSIFR